MCINAVYRVNSPPFCLCVQMDPGACSCSGIQQRTVRAMTTDLTTLRRPLPRHLLRNGHALFLRMRAYAESRGAEHWRGDPGPKKLTVGGQPVLQALRLLLPRLHYNTG